MHHGRPHIQGKGGWMSGVLQRRAASAAWAREPVDRLVVVRALHLHAVWRTCTQCPMGDEHWGTCRQCPPKNGVTTAELALWHQLLRSGPFRLHFWPVSFWLLFRRKWPVGGLLLPLSFLPRKTVSGTECAAALASSFPGPLAFGDTDVSIHFSQWLFWPAVLREEQQFPSREDLKFSCYRWRDHDLPRGALALARQIDHQNAEPRAAQGRKEFRITKKANPFLLNRAGERRFDYE